MQRVPTFCHAFVGTSKGFALLVWTRKGFALLGKICEGFVFLGTDLRNIQKGLHVCANHGQNLKRDRTFEKGLRRVRTFGHGLANYSEGLALLDIVSKGCALFVIFWFRREGIAVFGHKRHNAKTSKVKRPFLLHSAFMELS